MSRIPAPWLKSILLTIYPKPAITRDEIIRSTRLNPASVSQALQHLLSLGTVSVGISCPGIIHENRRVTAVNLGWRKFPLSEKLKEATQLPLSLETACRAYVLAERWLGCAQGVDNCIYIEIGRGVGAGIVVDGRYLEVHDHMAGEFGHITIDASADDPCHCGKRGCLEAIASSSGILRQYRER